MEQKRPRKRRRRRPRKKQDAVATAIGQSYRRWKQLLASKEKESEQHAAATAPYEKVSIAEGQLAAAPEKRKPGRPPGTKNFLYKRAFELKQSGKEWADIFEELKISAADQQEKKRTRDAVGKQIQRNQAQATKPSQKATKLVQSSDETTSE